VSAPNPGRSVRAADADRQAVADRLLRALEEGRLDLLEYDDRLARAYRALTYGELAELLTDLPAQPRPAAAPDPGAAPARPLPAPLRALATLWTAVVAINLTVWLLVSIGIGRPDYFWPMWLAVPGALLVALRAALRGGARPPAR
jgi:hypothetical protein